MSSGEAAFQSRNKLKSPDEIRSVFATKQRSADKQFLFLIKDNGLGYARLGLAVPKRHVSSAVKRNRIKRVIREAFRFEKEKFAGTDLMVLVKGPLDNINLTKFNTVLSSHWNRLNKCKPS